MTSVAPFHLSLLQAYELVLKYPTLLMSPTHVLGNKLAALRHLCSAREQWVRDVDEISINMLAFFFRDSTDCLLRLEYLASTGGCNWMEGTPGVHTDV